MGFFHDLKGRFLFYILFDLKNASSKTLKLKWYVTTAFIRKLKSIV